MKDKKTLAKLAVTGLLLAANMPAAMQAEAKTGREVYMAVAGCGAGCKLSTDSSSGKAKSLGGTKSAEDIADADDDATAEKSDHASDSSGSTNGTGAKTTSGSYGNPNNPPKK